MRYTTRKRLLAYASLLAMCSNTFAPAAMAAVHGANDGKTTTPIKHVIIIYGENRTFDHLFGTYTPPKGSVSNLLSKGIVNADGTPGPNVSLAKQFYATDSKVFSIAPTMGKRAYATLPPLLAGGGQAASDTNPPPFATLTAAAQYDLSLETSNGYTSLFPGIVPGATGNDVTMLTTGATGLPRGSVDTRVPNAGAPANAPIPLTGGASTLTYDDYASSPVHRFYQMWQQMDCSAAYATSINPSGCLNDLFPWVEVTVGAGSNGKAQPAGFNNMSTGEGSTSMGFYNVAHGDMPYFKQLADTYALGDNYHQPVKGGTGVDSVYLGFASDVFYTDANGKPAVPPSNQIANPNPQPGTNNYYTQDGYSGGSYSNCSSPRDPGVGPIRRYMSQLSYKPAEVCQHGHYYLLNNYNPGFNGDGTLNTSSPFTIPPQSQLSIANTLDKARVSWTYYGEDWNKFVAKDPTATYCNICNPFLYQSYVMQNPTKRSSNLKDTLDLFSDISKGTLPAVSYVKPGWLNDGHPASSKFDIFEAYTKKIIDALQAQPALWADTAVFITVDEGGGYWDSGFVQTVDWFGDGTRIPMLVVSPYSAGVGVVHGYGDHASVIKFINANWSLKPITRVSRDNLPNPVATKLNPYVPTNMPAIDDLMEYFNFPATP